MGTNQIVFNPSDIDEQASAAIAVPKRATPTPISSHVTFSPSDIDENASAATAPAASTAQPAQQSTFQNIVQGIKQSAPVQLISSAITPPESADEHIASLAGPGALIAYRQAKGVVASVKGAMTSSGTKFVQAVQDVKSAADQFHRGDYRNAASSAVSAATDAAGLLDPMTAPVSSGVRELSEGARPGGNLATPLTRQLIDAGTALVGGKFGSEAIGDAAGDAEGSTAAVKPVAGTTADDVAATNAAKSGLPAGSAAQTEAPTIQSASPNVQQAIRDSANDVAQNEGLQSVPDSTPIRETFNNLRDQFYARSKSGFAEIQEATGVDLNQLQQDINKLGRKISDSVGEPDRVDSLTEQLQAKQEVADQAFADAEKAGIDTKQAVGDWRKMNAADEMNAHVVNSTSGRPGIGSGEITDPTKLAPRLDKASVSQSSTRPGRLQEFMGNDTANKLADTIEAHRGAIKDFSPTTSTGQKAMQDLIRPNTGTGKVAAIKQSLGFTPKTNWIGTYSDMSKLGDAEMSSRFGADAAQARSFVASQARWQVGKMLAKGVGIAVISRVTGLNGAIIHALVE